MGTISYTTPTVGQNNSTEEPLIVTALNAIKALLNGNIDEDNIDPAARIALTQLADLAAGKLVIGNASNRPVAATPSGDVSMDDTGAFMLTGGVTAAITDRPTIQSDTSSALTNLTPSTYTSSGTFITAAQTGLHLVTCSGQVTNDASSNGLVVHYSSLLDHSLAQTGTELIDQRYVGGTPGLSIPFTHAEFLVITSGQNVHHAIKPTSTGSDIASGAFKMKAIPISL